MGKLVLIMLYIIMDTEKMARLAYYNCNHLSKKKFIF